MSDGFVIDRIGADDVPALMAIERLEGYDRLVGRWEADRHMAELADPGTRYFALRDAERLAGFAIMLTQDAANRRAHLKRIAVADPGRGAGAVLLAGLVDTLFAETEFNRLDLDLYPENERARRAYEKAGFAVEGRMREHHREADGSYRDVLLMSILRRDWEARRAT